MFEGKRKQSKITFEVSCPYGTKEVGRKDKTIKTNPKNHKRSLKKSGCPIGHPKCSKCNG